MSSSDNERQHLIAESISDQTLKELSKTCQHAWLMSVWATFRHLKYLHYFEQLLLAAALKRKKCTAGVH